MDLTQKKISAVIACYRDAEAIPHMHRRLTEVFQKIGCQYEIIFVNDGSPDNSEVVLRELTQADAHVVAVMHSRNFSSQNAFLSGMSVATGNAVVLLDGDLQDPPEIIEQFTEKWSQGYDVVYGIRQKREATLFLRVSYKLFYLLFSSLANIKVPRDAGDFSLMDETVYKEIVAMPERDLFLRGLRAWVGYKQIGVPYFRPERMFGKTTNNFLKNVRWAKKGVFSFSYEPLEFIFYMAIVLAGVSFLAILFYIYSYFTSPSEAKGISTLIVLAFFFSSVQLISLSIIGEYVGRIFEEVKQRPRYIVKTILNDPRSTRDQADKNN